VATLIGLSFPAHAANRTIFRNCSGDPCVIGVPSSSCAASTLAWRLSIWAFHSSSFALVFSTPASCADRFSSLILSSFRVGFWDHIRERWHGGTGPEAAPANQGRSGAPAEIARHARRFRG
jgi:hypothetical protein